MVDGISTIMLGSNNYLGLASHPKVVESAKTALDTYGAGVAVNPSFLTTSVHRELGDLLTEFMGVEAALLFASCSAANHGLLATLVGAGDTIFSDAMNHASIIDGCRLSRARTRVYKTCDLDSLGSELAASDSNGQRLIVTDGVFSMEGTLAPLRDIIALARRHGAIVAVDESHAAGVVGSKGAGTASALGLTPSERESLIYTGTLSKAFGGAGGGYVAGPRAVIDELARRGRAFIFTTGMSPAVAAAAKTAIEIHLREPEHHQRLWENTGRLRNGLEKIGLQVAFGDSPITPILIGDEELAVRFSEDLRADGVFIPSMTYPIVAHGDARLRAQPSAALTSQDMDDALGTLEEIGAFLGVSKCR